MIYEQGINSTDFKTLDSKLKRANVEQLHFLKLVIDNELVKRNHQDGGLY